MHGYGIMRFRRGEAIEDGKCDVFRGEWKSDKMYDGVYTNVRNEWSFEGRFEEDCPVAGSTERKKEHLKRPQTIIERCKNVVKGILEECDLALERMEDRDYENPSGLRFTIAKSGL